MSNVQYAVDVVFEAFDKSAATFEDIKDRMIALEQLNKRVGGQAAGGGETAGGMVQSAAGLDGMMNKLIGRFAGVAGIRMGIDAVVAGIKIWQFETSKLNDPITKVLEKQIAAEDSVKAILRDIPFVGSAVVRLMDAFDDNRGAKELLKDVQEIENTIQRTASQIKAMSWDTSQSMMKSFGFPESSVAESAIAKAREKRQEEIKAAEKAMFDAREAVKNMQKREDDAAVLITMMNSVGMTGMTVSPPEIEPDRTMSEKLRRETLEPAEKAYQERVAQEAQAQQAEEMQLEQMRRQEAKAAQDEQDKQFQTAAENEDKLHQKTMDNLRRIDELRARQIRDSLTREKELINIKYDYEIQRAREAGENTGILDLMRQIELAGLDKPGRLNGKGLAAEEVRYMGGAYGSGPSAVVQYQRDATGLMRRQADLLLKIDRGIQRMIQLAAGRGNGIVISDFN